MLGNSRCALAADPGLDPFEVVEFELALDLQDLTRTSFGKCVRNAASVLGGELLFEMPTDGSIEDARRIAAIRLPGTKRDRLLFAVLDEAGSSIRAPHREEVGERFYGFARAFVGVLEKLREDQSFAGLKAEGNA